MNELKRLQWENLILEIHTQALLNAYPYLCLLWMMLK